MESAAEPVEKAQVFMVQACFNCLHGRRLGLPVESAGGDVEKVHRALARGLFVNAVRLEGTSYDMYNSARMGAHAYALIRGGGSGAS